MKRVMMAVTMMFALSCFAQTSGGSSSSGNMSSSGQGSSSGSMDSSQSGSTSNGSMNNSLRSKSGISQSQRNSCYESAGVAPVIQHYAAQSLSAFRICVGSLGLLLVHDAEIGKSIDDELHCDCG